MNDVNFYLDAAEKKMSEAVAYLDDSLAHIRAGKANVKILDSIRVEYYGSKVPIGNVANISTPDQRTIAIMPWEKNMFRVIEKAIIDSNVGIMPESNGEVIRLSIPPLTEDRRKQLVKDSKAEAEKARVSVRNARRDAIEGLKKAIKEGMSEDVSKDGEAKVQKIHDKYMKRIDEVFAAKEKEILTV
ncbi:MAG: ribosome recycling factor [Muribaculaceae bacterium]|nr:ribosome recycling factor [Muribaculaceae bacterium]MBQ4006229.1 ribosome recycling factor [Muribaculaceae bacterium]